MVEQIDGHLTLTSHKILGTGLQPTSTSPILHRLWTRMAIDLWLMLGNQFISMVVDETKKGS